MHSSIHSNTHLQHIVLTRPITQAQPLADKLTALGYSVRLFPLQEIAPLPEQSDLHRTLQNTINNLSRYAIAAFVSPNAIHTVFAKGLNWPPEVPIAIMGEGSRIALAQYGVNEKNTRIYCPADPSRSDSETLLQEIDLPALKGREVVIFRAETGRELLSDALLTHGIHVSKVISYRRFALPMTAQRGQLLQELLAAGDAWVINSSEAVRTLVDMIEHNASTEFPVMHQLQQMPLWLSHHRIAETAEKCGFKRIRLIGSGDENLLLALQSAAVI